MVITYKSRRRSLIELNSIQKAWDKGFAVVALISDKDISEWNNYKYLQPNDLIQIINT